MASQHVETQAEWEIRMGEKVLAFVQNELYMEMRFLKRALSVLVWKPKEGLMALATDGTCLYYKPEHVIRVFQSNSAFLDRAYLHSVLHCLFFHLWTRQGRNEKLWQIACDIAVEYTIDRMNKQCVKRALSYLREQVYKEVSESETAVSAGTVYQWLMVQPQNRLSQLWKEFYTDDHAFWPKEEQENAMQMPQRKVWEKIARQTSLEQRMQGQEDTEGEELLKRQMKVQKRQKSYGDFLRKFAVLREEMKCDPDEFDISFYSYGIEMYGNLALIEPLESRQEKKIPEFVVVIDTSDSTSGELVESFLRETCAILSQGSYFGKGCVVRLLQCDNQVRQETVIRSSEDVERLLSQFELCGGGGTDFRPAFSYVEQLRKEGEIKDLCGLIYFTDGKGTYPEKRPDYKTAFIFMDENETDLPQWAIGYENWRLK